MEANYEKDGDEFADFSVKNSYDSLWTTVSHDSHDSYIRSLELDWT